MHTKISDLLFSKKSRLVTEQARQQSDYYASLNRNQIIQISAEVVGKIVWDTVVDF